jgi:tetratricopeptide (TPR) repeat protein
MTKSLIRIILHSLRYTGSPFQQPLIHRRRILLLLITAALGLNLIGCSTKKKGFVNRFYHNTTAKYNGYWNGRESIREGVRTLEQSQQDDFERILPIYPIGTAQTATSIYPQMDRAIEKASMVIAKHSMLIKGKEYCNWIDDSYMLIGQSHYYKRDQMDALEIFNYVIKQYQKEKIRFDGYKWLLRTNTAMGRFNDGETMILKLEEEAEEGTIPKKMKPAIAAAKAEYFIETMEYTKAKDELMFAINNTKRRKTRVRYMFILAQLYAELSMKDSAVHWYSEVLKRSTPYEMEFNARINRALLTSAKSGNLNDIKRELVKMSKDDKNIDYLDRIFFALGNIALEEGEKDLALDYLRKSVAASTANTTQKAVSHFTIADLYFDKAEYIPSGGHYDTAMMTLPELHPEYKRVSLRQESLADLVKNIRIIAYEDSMLKLGNMTDSQLDAFIDDLIADVKRKEEQRKFEEEAAAMNNQLMMQQGGANRPGGPGGGGGAGWYFYNTTAVSYGINDFRQRWGDRKLEDNWRRSTKSVVFEDDPDGEGGKPQEEASVSELMNPEFYRKNIPRTEAQKDSAHRRIQYAFYDLGVIYKEKLSEIDLSIQSFEELLKRYPKGLFPLESYYQLYRLYTQKGNVDEANRYKNLILQQFPDSEYAKILSDPTYLDRMEAMKGKIAGMYDRAFENFGKGEHEKVIAAADSVISKFKEEKLRPKFALLRAMSIGATERLTTYRAALEAVIRDFPADPEKEKAEELLGYVKSLMGETLEDEPQAEEQPKEVEKEKVYDLNMEANHYFAVIVPKSIPVADVKSRLANFHQRQFSVEKLTVKNVQLTPQFEMVFVQGFGATKKAQDYLVSIKADNEVFDGLERSQLSEFLISDKNFTIFYKRKDVEEYLEFFRENYN